MFDEFQKIGKYLFQEGLVNSHGGSLSIREGDKIFITRRGCMLGEFKKEDILELPLELKEKNDQAAQDLSIHRTIYRDTQAKAVIHAHPASAVAISITDNKVVPQDAEGSQLFRSAPIVRGRDEVGAEETANLVPTFFVGGSVIIVVKGHGSFAIGKTLEEAYSYTSALENSCKIIVAVRASGGRQPHREKPDQAPRQPLHQRSMHHQRSGIPPGIGVMDRSRYNKR
ncbi:MAG: class II aldolase/adducin family protein [Candidatus Margulisbacteria bacterium]|nr:class II aldolase/adducin family protein [Candidatus Margulisiibacteriota bacterium]